MIRTLFKATLGLMTSPYIAETVIDGFKDGGYGNKIDAFMKKETAKKVAKTLAGVGLSVAESEIKNAQNRCQQQQTTTKRIYYVPSEEEYPDMPFQFDPRVWPEVYPHKDVTVRKERPLKVAEKAILDAAGKEVSRLRTTYKL